MSTDARRRIRGTGEIQPPPDPDPAKIGRVGARVELRAIELIGCHFDRADDGPFPTTAPAETPEFAMGAAWELDEDAGLLGCVLTFGADFEDAGPYSLIARYRATYSVGPSEDLSDDDIEQFAQWNAVFNVWPYWREFVGTILDRADLPRIAVPIMRIPVARAAEGEEGVT